MKLSCGPIFEPILAMSISALICLILFIYGFKKIKDSTFYNSYFEEDSLGYKRFKLLMFGTLCLGVFIATFFLLTFLITGILL
jgi:hypothetical protein